MRDLLNCQLAILLTLIFFNFGSSQDVAMAMVPRISHVNPEHSIVKSARESGKHKILVEAIKVANLDEILDNDGAFTFFAPSDEAFKKFPLKKFQTLIESENKNELRALLTYHIVAGNFSASKILKALCRGNGVATFTTLQGTKITATMDGVDILLTDGFGNSAKIVKADTNQCNGIIHVVDNVIVPSKTLP